MAETNVKKLYQSRIPILPIPEIVPSRNPTSRWNWHRRFLMIVQVSSTMMKYYYMRWVQSLTNLLILILSQKKKIEAKFNVAVPTNIHWIRLLLGDTNHYKQLIPQQRKSHLCAPLMCLMQKNVPFTGPIPLH
jgi:hypothetical protein